MRRRRGSMLVAALLLSALFLVMAMTALSLGSREYEGAQYGMPTLQARALAEAGVFDAQVKLMKDPLFPPVPPERSVFSYSETVVDPGTGTRVGTYTVEVDVSRREPPFGAELNKQATYDYPNFTVGIRSTGRVVGATDQTFAVRTLVAELDVSPKARGVAPQKPYTSASDGYVTNPSFMKFLRWEDSGSP